MGIFGQLDAENIPANPFFIEAGDYAAEVTDGKYSKDKNGKKQLVIEYTIDDENSTFNNKKATRYYPLTDDDMTAEMFKLLPVAEQATIQRNMSTLKRDLCGRNERQPGLGIPAEDLNDPNWDPAVLRGLKVNISISNFGEDGVNVRYVNLRQD